MCQQATNVVTSQLREASIAFTIVEKWLFAAPQALMNVHTRAVIAKDGFGHESDGFTVLARRILCHVLIQHQVICSLQERVETHINFCLSCSTYLVVLCLDRYP